MKDKKFGILCILGIIWLLIFILMIFGIKIHPRIEQLITIFCVLWFGYWTFSYIFSKNESELNNKKQKNKKSI